jgi:hypothetical protein
MEFVKNRPGLSLLLTFIVGWFVGLVIFGWWLTPVQWTDAYPDTWAPQYQDAYIQSTADLYSFQNDPVAVQTAFVGWSDPYGSICETATRTTDPADLQRLDAIAIIMGGQPCPAATAPPADGSVTTPGATAPGETPPPAETADGGNTTIFLLLVLVLLGLAIAIVFLLRKRGSSTDDGEASTYYDMPEAGPQGDAETTAIPIARFPSSYAYGRDNFDDSHSIENANGDFLGECGVGISETIGTDSPRNIAAFEVWLFDKNDIRTVTKVIMSDHAFFDDATKAKLAPKGEPVLARENEVIVLETASLIINAEIRQLEYGVSDALPPQSYFENFAIELSVWAKEGDYSEPDVEGQVDEILDY